MRIVLPFLFTLIAFSTFALGDSIITYQRCADNNTLSVITETHISVPEKDLNRTFIALENQTCPDGCNIEHNQCYSSPASNWLWVIFGIFCLIIFVLLIMWVFYR